MSEPSNEIDPKSSDYAREAILAALRDHQPEAKRVEVKLPGGATLPVKIKPLTFKARNRIVQSAANAGDDQITATIVQAIIRCCVAEDGSPIFGDEDARALERSAPGGIVDQLSAHVQSVLNVEDPEGNG